MTSRRFDLAVQAIGLATVTIGIFVLASWALDEDVLKGVTSELRTMKADTALALALGGCGLMLLRESASPRSKRAGRLLGALVAGIGLAVIAEYLVGDLGIDELLFSDTGDHPGRPSAHTAAALVAIGVTLGAVDSDRVAWLYPALVPASAAIVLAAVTGYLFEVDYLHGAGGAAGLSVLTLVALALATLGLALLRPDRGVVGYLRRDDPGAAMARRLLPIGLLVPLALGIVRYEAGRGGTFDLGSGVAFMVLSATAISVGAILVIARQLSIADRHRRHTERAREELAAIVDSSEDAIIGETLDGRIVSWNRGAERLYGYPPGEIVGRSATVLAPPDRREELSELLARVGRGESVAHVETVRLRRGGSRVDVSLSISPRRGARGEVVGAATIERDLTERKLAERELERSHDELRQFYSSVTHELRTPLTSILGYLEILKEDAVDLGPEGADALEIIERNAGRELRFVEDLLSTASSQEAGFALELETIDLAFIVRDAVAGMRPACEQKQIAVAVAVDGPLGMTGDPDRLNQVVTNLLSNAIKFTPAGDRITVSLHAADDTATLTVADTGPGIGEADRDRVFERLYRGEQAKRKRIPGAGLGLSIAQSIVHAHGGAIRVRDDGSPGTVLEVSLPIGDASVSALP